MINLFKKYSITLLNKSWVGILNEKTKVKFIPRQGELIFIEQTKKYYKVLNVIYYLNRKQGIFVIVEEFSDETPKV